MSRPASCLLFGLASLALLCAPASALAFTQMLSASTTVDGQAHSFSFTSLPAAAGSVTLTVGLQGDFSYGDLSNPEGSQNYADGNFLGSFIPANVGSSGDCTGAVYTTSYTFPAAYINDNSAVVILIDLYAEVGTFCGGQQVISATINYSSNSAPSISVIADQSGPEDTADSVTFTVSDAEDSAGAIGVAASSSSTNVIATVGAVNSAGAGTLTWTPVGNATGTTTITVTATDSGGATATESFEVAVTPVNDPPVGDAGGPYAGFEGTAVPLDGGDSYDIDDSIVSYGWDCDDDGVIDQVVVSSTGGSCTFDDDGSYVVGLLARDASGAYSFVSLTSIEIDNVAPTLVLTGPTTGNEGEARSYSAVATDPSVLDSAGLVFGWVVTNGAGASVATGSGPSFGFTPPDDGGFTVTGTVSDPDGGNDTDSVVLTVSNVAPTLSITGTASGDEGAALLWTLNGADVGPTDSAILAYFWTVADAGSAIVESGIGSAPTWTPADDGLYTLSATVTDPQGASDVATLALTVSNVAPVISTTAPTAAPEGDVYSYQPGVTDPGDEVFAWTLSASAPAGMTVDGATGLVSWTPTYAQALTGSYGVVLSVDDGDGGSDAQSFTLVVTAADDDGDGMADGWELGNGLDPTDPSDAGLDPDGDGMSNLIEFGWGTDPAVFDGPDAPTPVSPVGGVEVAEVSPDLLWDNAYDAQGQTLTYEVEVYSDAALLTLVTSASGVLEDAAGQSTWKVDVSLPEDAECWWRVRANDSWTDGPFSAAVSFVVNAGNTPPEAPVLTFPLDGEITGLLPTLLWVESADADGDAVTYVVEVYDGLGDVVAWDGDLEGDGLVGTWTSDVTLAEDNLYSWTAWAVDEHGLAGPAAAPEDFWVSADNGAPSATVFLAPTDGLGITSLAPDLEATVSVDPEGGAVEYFLELDLDVNFGSFEYRSSTETSPLWSLEDDGITLPEDRWIFARVRAIDAAGISSVPDTISFFVRGDNDPPNVPVLFSPGDGEEGAASPTLVVEDPVDPEGDVVFVDFVVATDAAMTDVIAGVEGALVPGDGVTSWLVDVGLTGTVYWSARAVDGFGAESAWATPFAYVAPSEAVPPPGDDDDDDGCDCETSVAGGPGASGGLAGLLAVGVALLGRRRRG